MNLKALRQQIKNITDYSPDLQSFNDQIDVLLNNAYYEIWSSKRWNFTSKEVTIKMHPDIRPDRDAVGAGGANANVSKSSRRVTFSTSIDRLTSEWNGQPMEIQGREYTISKVINNNTLLLTEPFVGATNSDETDWLIKRRWYHLPSDAVELLFIGQREYPITSGKTAKLTSLLPRREEEFRLDADKADDHAKAYIIAPPKNIPSGETLDLSETEGGNIASGHYEICWCFEKDGIYGPLSEPKTIQIGSLGNHTISVDFKSWSDEPIFADPFNSLDRRPTQYEGYRKVLFWNANFSRSSSERIGIPKWKHITLGGPVRNTETYLDPFIVSDTVSSAQIQWASCFDPGSDTYKEIDGHHITFRTWPRIDGYDQYISPQALPNLPAVREDFFRKLVVRYLRKPEPLSMKTDVPELPYEFHQLIVYKALEDIYLKLGSSSMAQTYRKRIDKEIESLRKRYTDRIDQNIRRGQFSKGSTSKQFFPWDIRWL